MTVYAFYIKAEALSEKLRDHMFIDIDKDSVLEDEVAQGAILYAWTKDKDLAECFQSMRSKRFCRLKLRFEESNKEFEEFEGIFGEREIYHDKIVTRNEEVKNGEATVDIPIVITSFESHHVDRYWEFLDEDFYDMIKEDEYGEKLYYSFYEIMKPEYREALDTLSYTETLDEVMVWLEEGRFNHGIILDEFAVLMDVYGETFS